MVIHDIDQYRWVIGSIFSDTMVPTLKLRFKQSELQRGMWKCRLIPNPLSLMTQVDGFGTMWKWCRKSCLIWYFFFLSHNIYWLSKIIQVVVSKSELNCELNEPIVPNFPSTFCTSFARGKPRLVFAIRVQVHPAWGPPWLSYTFAACGTTGIARTKGVHTVMIFEHCNNLFVVDNLSRRCCFFAFRLANCFLWSSDFFDFKTADRSIHFGVGGGGCGGMISRGVTLVLRCQPQS